MIAQLFPKGSVREALGAWAGTLAGLLLLTLAGRAVPYLGQLTGALAVAAFLWVPSLLLERRHLDASDAGFRFDHLGRDLRWGLGACAVVLPLFTLGFLWFTAAVPSLPAPLRGVIAPYLVARGPMMHGLPAGWDARLDLLGRVAGNAAVALAEEFFYRGWLTGQLEAAWPPQARLLGVRFGRGALLANALFAAGHLLVLAPWRLATFFPGLLFGWLRARTGTIGAPAICHWLCNVWLLLLEVAAYG